MSVEIVDFKATKQYSALSWKGCQLGLLAIFNFIGWPEFWTLIYVKQEAFAIIIIGLSVWRLRPVNEIKRKWWTIFFYWKEREKLGCYDCFSIGLIWIVNSSAENFHLWTALLKMSNISLEGFYWYKDNLSGRRFCGENFQVPWNKDLAFESSLFLVTMTSTTATSEAKNKLAVSRS